MTKIISLIVLQALFCFTLFPLSHSDNALIESTCKQTPFYDLCVSILESDPRSSSATVSELALIAARSVFATASGTSYQISTMLRSATDPNLKKALSACVDSYNTITKTDIPAAVEALGANNPKVAVSSASDAGNEAQKCEDGFGGKSPITDNNKMVHDRAVILQSIASLIH